MNREQIEAALQAELVPVSIVASIFAVSVVTIYTLIKVGRLEAVDIGTGDRPKYRVRSESVKRLLDQRQAVTR